MGFIIHDILTLKELEHLKKSAIGQFERAATTTTDKKASTLNETKSKYSFTYSLITGVCLQFPKNTVQFMAAK